MKRLLCCLFVVAASIGAKASHLMGGELVVKNVGTNQYQIRLTEYRDTLGIPLYASETMEMYTYDSLTSTYTLDSSWSIYLDSALSLPLLPNFPYGVEVGIYTSNITLPSGKYRFVMSSCCRNASILNMSNPSAESLVLYTDITVDPGGMNSSPDFLAMPVTYFQINDTVNFNPLPFDPDGDSLAWSLNIPYSSVSNGGIFTTVAGFSVPSADPAGPFTMNPVSGEITWIPNQLGNFVQSFVVDEYRNGVKIGSIVRDFQYVIVPEDTTNPNVPFFIVSNPNVQYNAAQDYSWMYYYNNDPLNFEIKGSDVDPGASLQLNGYSEIFTLPSNPATFTTATLNSEITGTLNWTPSATYNRNVILVFRLRDGNWTRDFTLLLTRSPFPANVANTTAAVNQLTVFPNPASNMLNIAVDLNESIDGDIALYNVVGQQVANIHRGTLARGKHMMQANLNLAAGTYNMVVRNGNQIIQHTSVVVR